MKKLAFLISLLVLCISCQQSETLLIIPEQKSPKVVNNFGFNFNDYNILQDTIQKGDTFGSILENQNLEDKKVYDIIDKVKDSFSVRTIKIGKPFTYTLYGILPYIPTSF